MEVLTIVLSSLFCLIYLDLDLSHFKLKVLLGLEIEYIGDQIQLQEILIMLY